jgi:hypothetical protein
MIARMAKATDYVQCEGMFPGMYRLTWCDYICAGNPTADPEKGAEEFNDWHLRLVRGEATAVVPAVRVTHTVRWCLEHPSYEPAIAIARWIVDSYKNPGEALAIEVRGDVLDAEARGHAIDIQFFKDEIADIPASVILQLQNMLHEEC